MIGILNTLFVPKTLNYGAIRAKSMFHKVFVYGTLKQNEPNHHWLTNKENGESSFHAYGATVTKYPLIIATRYNIPFLLKDPGNGHFVKGEVYNVDEDMLGRLDLLEDHPNYYEREQDDILIVKENSFSGQATEQHERCWVYFLRKFKPELLKYPMLDSYTSGGPHGKQYLESGNESTIADLNDVFVKK
ncbi:unnamed protein product [Arctia plantaginis]|uniref:Gamma-glutamylcyclotransferase family protein n=1 Tax=Arctia plantaginis TaxID=874455 RepID=A0A8S0YUR9_ARCPL|nr:unnamed protein product [Arctia plantaginis]